MSQRTKHFGYICLCLVLFIFHFLPVRAADYDYDLAIGPGDISFSEDLLITGQQIRIYAKVHNVGNQDLVGYVSFFRGTILIGNSQPVSVLPGSGDDVFVDFTVPVDSFNIQAKIQGTEPVDQNAGNNETQTTVFYPDVDTDGDGTVDRLDNDDDNDGLLDTQEQGTCTDPLKADTDSDGVNDQADKFPCNPAETLDTDNDGLGDNADVDDDNDGWSDSQEQSHGTDPLRKDTDGDGVNDPQDAYPLDPTRSQQESGSRNIFQPPTGPAGQASGQTGNNNNQNGVSGPFNEEQLQQTLEELKQQAEDKSSSNEAENKLKEQPLEKLGEAMENVSNRSTAFFRLNNWLIWLILIIVVALIAILFFLIKRQKGRVSGAGLDSLKKSNLLEKALPKPVKKEEPGSTEVKKKLPRNVVDLKEIIKRKKGL